MEGGRAGRSEISAGPVADRNARWSRLSLTWLIRVSFAKLPVPRFLLHHGDLRPELLAGLALVAFGLKIQLRKGSLTIIVVKLPGSQVTATVPP